MVEQLHAHHADLSGPEFYLTHLREDPHLREELDYCVPRGVAHSAFLNWAADDQDKALAWMRYQTDKRRHRTVIIFMLISVAMLAVAAISWFEGASLLVSASLLSVAVLSFLASLRRSRQP